MKLFVLFLSLLAVSGVFVTFGRETDAAYFSRAPELSSFEAFATDSGVPDLPLSSRSMRELLETCGAVQQGAVYLFQPPETKRAVDTTCGNLARKALEENPTYSGGHSIQMLSSADPAAIADALVLSHVTGRLESWHAKLRLRKGMPLYGTLQPELDSALDADIAFMVQSASGRAWLAKLYISNEGFRPTIVKALEGRPNDEKAAFLSEVRRVGEN